MGDLLRVKARLSVVLAAFVCVGFGAGVWAQMPGAAPLPKTMLTEPPTPLLRGVGLPADVLEQVYHHNARRLLGR